MSTKIKYRILFEEIKSQIVSGHYPYGSKLPTEGEISEQYGVSRFTVRSALRLLEEQKYIRRIQGSGSYVKYQSYPRMSTMRIAVVVTYISSYIFPSILRAIEKTATASGYTISLFATNNSLVAERRIINNLLSSDWDGVIFEGTKTALPCPNIDLFSEIADKTPIVFINGYPSGLSHKNICSVTMDDYNGGMKAAKLLMEKGHKKIAGIFKCDDQQGVNRYSGFLDYLIANCPDFDDTNIIWYNTETKFDFLSNNSILESILTSCTGMVCYNDEIATQLAPILLSDLGYSVTSLISFDNAISLFIGQDFDFYSLPHPKGVLGEKAVKMLIDMIDGKPTTHCVQDWT